jgi:hypothetical protein
MGWGIANYNELGRIYTERIIKDSTVFMEEINETKLESAALWSVRR